MEIDLHISAMQNGSVDHCGRAVSMQQRTIGHAALHNQVHIGTANLVSGCVRAWKQSHIQTNKQTNKQKPEQKA
jgi:hypothetical protein